MLNKTEPILDDKLNLETARILWSELERHFAAGRVIIAGPSLDLIEVAHAVATDDADHVRHWMEAEQLQAVTDNQARSWQSINQEFWGVVVKPWVLVQLVS